MKKAQDITALRRVLEAGGLPVPQNITFTPAILAGIAGEWAQAENPGPHTLLYLHGGGYFACSPRTHRPITAAFAQRGFSVFVPEYRLAPEHPYPAAIEDALAVWDALVALGHAPASLTVAGDSAGGGLTLALLLSLRDRATTLPAAAALFSPWTDLAGTGPSVQSNAARDAMFWAPGLLHGASFYLGNTPPQTPLASPLYADLAGLPPLIIQCGDREILRDDSTRVAQRARDAGIEVALKIWPVVPHVWQLAQFIPEARASLDQASAFLKAHLPA